MDAYRDMFRREAWNHYEKGTEEQTFPRLVLPRSLLAFWLLLGLVMVLIGLVFLLPVPLRVQGYGVVLNEGEDSGAHAFLALFDAREARHIKPKMIVSVTHPQSRKARGLVVKLEPETYSLTEAIHAYPSFNAANLATSLAESNELVLAWIQLEEFGGVPGVLEVSGQYGRTRLAGFLPLVGDLFELETKDGS